MCNPPLLVDSWWYATFMWPGIFAWLGVLPLACLYACKICHLLVYDACKISYCFAICLSIRMPASFQANLPRTMRMLPTWIRAQKRLDVVFGSTWLFGPTDAGCRFWQQSLLEPTKIAVFLTFAKKTLRL